MQLLRMSEVIRITGLSRTTINDLVAAGVFPRPIRVGARAVRWFEHEVLAYINSRPRGGARG